MAQGWSGTGPLRAWKKCHIFLSSQWTQRQRCWITLYYLLYINVPHRCIKQIFRKLGKSIHIRCHQYYNLRWTFPSPSFIHHHRHTFIFLWRPFFPDFAGDIDIVCNLDSTSGWHSLVARQWCILDWFLYKSIRTISTLGCDCGSLWYGRTVVTIRITVNCVLYQSK